VLYFFHPSYFHLFFGLNDQLIDAYPHANGPHIGTERLAQRGMVLARTSQRTHHLPNCMAGSMLLIGSGVKTVRRHRS